MTDNLFIGVDVSKDWLDIARHGGGGVERIGNNRNAFAAILARSIRVLPWSSSNRTAAMSARCARRRCRRNDGLGAREPRRAHQKWAELNEKG